MDPAYVVLLLVAGFGAGVCNAVAGGGSLLSFPALLAAGLPPVTATVTNAVAVWPGYLGGAAALRSRLTEHRSLLPRLIVTGIAGAVGGVIALLAAPPEVFAALVPYLVLAATALFAAQPVISRRLAEKGADSRFTMLVGVFLGGVYGAYFNGGMGIVLLTALALGIDASVNMLNGLKSLLALIVSTTATVAVALFGPVEWWSVAVLAPACLAGGMLGAKIADRLRPGVFRAVVIVFGAGAGVAMLFT
ncbi:sulfite exporter TauE/SafE family protein [Nocardia flavorosea]|uniref:Probable membrane transporter protein n=1 Tax=Nocardia flavorosea TaxID=53429 RepID=A0A846YHG9_9NOCA|nr:sulfite exporter TauE/SafE family protein [Nocardia flavorosea]NKY58467.1 sulfite exporter TauE/SafE family protein [Nocardia flavorosea]